MTYEAKKKRRNNKPRLQHEVGIRNPDGEEQNVRRCRLDYLINNIFLNDEKVKITYPEKLGHTK